MLNLGPYKATSLTKQVRIFPTFTDRMLEGVALLITLMMWGAALYIYLGTEDRASVSYVLQLAGVLTFASLIILICAYIPLRLINFPMRITDQNVAMQWFLAKRLCRVLVLFVPGFFFSAICGQSQIMGILPAEWRVGLLAATCILMVLSLIGYYAIALRQR